MPAFHRRVRSPECRVTRPARPGRACDRTSWPATYRLIAGLLCAAPLAACAGGDAAARWVAEVDTVGDTVVVRTLSGGDWGDVATLVTDVRIGELEGDDEYLLGDVRGIAVDQQGNIYAYDAQGPSLRKYDTGGRFVMNIGRQGGGPGEYKSSDGGMTILRDGRLVLRDPGNARFQVWTADGQAAGEWRYRGGFFTSMPMFIDTAGRAYSSTVDFSTAPPWKAALVRYAQDGAPLDTLPVPDWDWKEPTISAQKSDKGNTSTMVNTVPFSAAEQWTFSPLGYFVGGVSDHYAITLFRPEGALRIERVVEPLPIDAAEKANAEEVATDNMRGMVSDWKWNGPPIPDTKPPWAALVVAQDGRIWVQVSQPGERIPEDELEEPKRAEDGRMPAVRKWREPVAFDVFQPDGRYVGRATAPTGFSMYPRPWIRGDTVWAVLKDDLGVQRLARLHVQLRTLQQ